MEHGTEPESVENAMPCLDIVDRPKTAVQNARGIEAETAAPFVHTEIMICVNVTINISIR